MHDRNRTFPIFCILAALLVAALPVRPASTAAATPTQPSLAPAPSAPVPPATGSATPPSPATDLATGVASPAPASPAPTAAKASKTMPYTVAKGDSWTKLARKFDSTRKKLKALNPAVTADKLTPGQVIQVPASKKAVAAATKKKAHHTYLAAQPVQDFDIPASTFASCPVPPPPDDDSYTTPPGQKSAPVAQLVSPAEAAAAEAELAREQQAQPPAPRLSVSPAKLPPPKLALAASGTATEKSAPAAAPSGQAHEPAWHGKLSLSSSSEAPSEPPAVSQAPASHGFFASIFGGNRGSDWGLKFTQHARELGDQGIEYDEDWRPPGENRSWDMDCSNTTRWLYEVTAGIKLPRTASDQYYYLRLQGKAWDVPSIAMGLPDTRYLAGHLKPGDLLFWENTYKPERQPPITHVMIFLGADAQGRWLMAGSQSSRGGQHNRRNGGPDIYFFRPSQPCGGYTTWMGIVHHKGRFCAFGRPLEADPSKFAVND